MASGKLKITAVADGFAYLRPIFLAVFFLFVGRVSTKQNYFNVNLQSELDHYFSAFEISLSVVHFIQPVTRFLNLFNACIQRISTIFHPLEKFFATNKGHNSEVMIRPARWCSGYSVRFEVGRRGVHSLGRAIPKDFKKWYSQLPCLALSIKKGIVWRTSRQASLLCPWAWNLTGHLQLYVADRWPTCTSPD